MQRFEGGIWWWGGSLASDEYLADHMCARHLLPWSRWNGVDLKLCWIMQSKWNLVIHLAWWGSSVHRDLKATCKTTSPCVSFWRNRIFLSLSIFPLRFSIYLFLFTPDLFIFQFLHINLLFHLVVYTLSWSCHTPDLSVPFFPHFYSISPPLLLVWAVIQLVSGPVRQPVELICLFRS